MSTDTNWGNLGQPGGYNSYDYGAAITEDRQVWREKYSELRVQANFLACSPAYLTAIPHNGANGAYTSIKSLTTTPLFSNATSFFVVRHANYTSLAVTEYTLTIPTSSGNITIPQTGCQMTLNGRDSKIHVTDYEMGDYSLLYSTTEIFTWQSSPSGTVLLVYGGIGEYHEIAIRGSPSAVLIEGSGVNITSLNGATLISWTTTTNRRIVKVSRDLHVYILDRNAVYDYWVLPTSAPQHLVARAGNLLRNATVHGAAPSIRGDINPTTSLEIISGAPLNLSSLLFNGDSVAFTQSATGVVSAELAYTAPSICLPALNLHAWKHHDSLPELNPDYTTTASGPALRTSLETRCAT